MNKFHIFMFVGAILALIISIYDESPIGLFYFGGWISGYIMSVFGIQYKKEDK